MMKMTETITAKVIFPELSVSMHLLGHKQMCPWFSRALLCGAMLLLTCLDNLTKSYHVYPVF